MFGITYHLFVGNPGHTNNITMWLFRYSDQSERDYAKASVHSHALKFE